MNKRLLKRHKRQVSRAKERIRLSEPDVRPPEQIRAAREASRAATDRRTGAHPRYSTPPTQRHAEAATDARLQPVRERSASTGSDPGGAAERNHKGDGGPETTFERGKEVM
jgi:hypothetical protein